MINLKLEFKYLFGEITPEVLTYIKSKRKVKTLSRKKRQEEFNRIQREDNAIRLVAFIKNAFKDRINDETYNLESNHIKICIPRSFEDSVDHDKVKEFLDHMANLGFRCKLDNFSSQADFCKCLHISWDNN